MNALITFEDIRKAYHERNLAWRLAEIADTTSKRHLRASIAAGKAGDSSTEAAELATFTEYRLLSLEYRRKVERIVAELHAAGETPFTY